VENIPISNLNKLATASAGCRRIRAYMERPRSTGPCATPVALNIEWVGILGCLQVKNATFFTYIYV